MWLIFTGSSRGKKAARQKNTGRDFFPVPQNGYRRMNGIICNMLSLPLQAGIHRQIFRNNDYESVSSIDPLKFRMME